MSRWKILPAISFCNFRKGNSNISSKAFRDWFHVSTAWYGRLIMFRIKHYQMTLDFRKNVLYDMMYPPQG